MMMFISKYKGDQVEDSEMNFSKHVCYKLQSKALQVMKKI